MSSGSFPSSWRDRQASRCHPSAISATIDTRTEDGDKMEDPLWESRDRGGPLGMILSLLPGAVALCGY